MSLSLLLLAGCPGDRDGDSQGSSGASGDNPPATPFGRFEGEVVAVWDEDGRNMTLNEDFAYIDPSEARWEAPAGSVVNGASIPRPFWSLIGGPFAGRYRNASVVHDVACEQMSQPWQSVHRMFYDACRCGGVGERMAKVMYWAVYNFGPRWNIVSETRTRRLPDGTSEEYSISRPVPIARAASIDEDLPQKAAEYFENHELTLEQIEALSTAEVMQSDEEPPE